MSPTRSKAYVLDRSQRERIKRLRQARLISVSQLHLATEISTKTLHKLEKSSDEKVSVNEGTLELVAAFLKIDLGQLLGLQPVDSLTGPLPNDLLEIADRFREIDRYLVRVVHALQLPSAGISEPYHDILEQRLGKAGHSREQVLEHLNSSDWREGVRTCLPKNHLTLEVGERFQSLCFSTPGATLNVSKPQLLWDCHHQTPCKRSKKFKCPIHDHPRGALIRSRFTSEPVVIKYDGLEFLWRYGTELFPPSVDSFHMLEVLARENDLDRPFDSCLDLGAGTGFLGICLAKRNGKIARVTLRDWLLSPVLFSAINAERNRKACPATRLSVELEYLAPPRFLANRRYDVVVCNPPYLPLLREFESLGWLSTVAGTDLLEFVIENAHEMGRQVYVQFSDLALPEARAARDRSGNQLVPIGKPHPTPFRVEVAWEDAGYLEALKDRGLKTRLEQRHPYWHTIQTYRVE